MKFSDTVRQVVRLAEAIRDYWDAELPRRHPDYPFVNPGEDSGPPPPEEQQLEALLLNLPAEEVYLLSLIMHLRRWDFGTDDLPGGLEELRERFPTPDRAAFHLTATASLADYLADGLEELEKSGIELDQLAFASSARSSQPPTGLAPVD